MHYIGMVLIGLISGAVIGRAFFSINSTLMKTISASGAFGVFILEFLLYEAQFPLPVEERLPLFITFLTISIITFIVFLINMFKLLKKQETRYKINTWEILLGDKKVIDNYYDSKEKEISLLLKDKFNIASLQKEKENNEVLKSYLDQKETSLRKLENKLEKITKKNQHIVIPLVHTLPVDDRFLEYIPKFIFNISDFYYHLNQFTDDFLENINFSNSKQEILKSYLTGLSLYVGQFIFHWKDIRIHFRVYDTQTKNYIKYISFEEEEIECQDILTSMPCNTGIINECIKSKRSLVKSANLQFHVKGNNDHIWENYLTMVFENFKIENQPILTMTISVKHNVEHQELLNFLSYIKIEQIIQSSLKKVNNKINISNSIREVA